MLYPGRKCCLGDLIHYFEVFMKKLVLVLCLTVAFVAGFAQAWAQVDTIAPKWVQKGKYAILSPNGELWPGLGAGKTILTRLVFTKQMTVQC